MNKDWLKFLEMGFYLGDNHITVGSILAFLMVMLVTQVVIWFVVLAINRAFSKKGPESVGQKYTIKKLARYFFYTIGIVVGLQTIGIEVSILLAGSAALLVGLGLGIQHIFDDFFSGFMLLFEGLVKVGDIVDLGDNVVRVEKIDLRTTKVLTRNGNILIVPNAQLTTNILENWSLGNNASRFKIIVGVAYGSDTEKVRSLLLKCALDHEQVLDTPAPRVDFIDFGDSALQFRLFFWANRSWIIDIHTSDLRFAIDKAFRENGIQIPFPQRVVHMPNQAPQPTVSSTD
jgi:small-conductance mechanosensitive channel